MIDAPLDSGYFQAQYERLRLEALDDRRLERGHGLALFLSRGMAAWMKALSTLQPGPTVAGDPANRDSGEDSVEIPRAVRSDLTAVLATMVLSCREGRTP